MTDRPLIALMLALLVEARHWTRFRWEFDDDACGRAWQFTSIAIALAAVLIWLDGNRYTALPGLLSWMPPLLLPMQFVQSYGMRDSLPLSTFSFLARHRRERNRRLGLTEEMKTFNFGNVLFTVTMVAATVGSKSDTWLFLPGMVVLTGWMLLAAGRSRALALIPVIAVAGLLAVAGEYGLERAEDWFGRASSGRSGRFDPNFVSTLIGTTGAVQQSPDIVWRLRPRENTAPPSLLRTATFNNFLGTNWRNQRSADDFTDLATLPIGDEFFHILQSAEQAATMLRLSDFTLRGAASEESPLPLPGDVAGLRDFEQDGIERNTFGTVRIFPKHSVIHGTVFWKGRTNPEKPPLPVEDLRIPTAEREVIREVVANLQLKSEPDLRLKLATIRSWFIEEFRYTRNLTIRQPLYRSTGTTAIGRFLTKTRAGHCEYFATATTLMLREAGIPARYATGFAVMERDVKRGEFVIRGTHGHAWCRVWDQNSGLWLDFDTTPPDWSATVSQPPSAMQWFNDGLKRLREDFFLWRNQPTKRLAVSLVMMGIGLIVAAFVVKRLWRSKRRLEARRRATGYEGPAVRTPLHDLEAAARKHLGHRPPGMPFAQWLARLRPSLPDDLTLDEALALHQRIRFDPETPPPSQRARLASLAKQLEAALKRK
jgi:hypothetical protein